MFGLYDLLIETSPMATRAAPLSDSRVRPTSFFSAVRESLSSGSRREESICRVSIASFDLCFNDLKRLRLQLHGVKPLLKSITHDLDYNASFSSQGCVSANIKRLAFLISKPSTQSVKIKQ